MADSCKLGGPTKDNQNCTVPGDDGQPVQHVGEWSKDKHDYLRRFLEAAANPRSKFIPPQGPGGAAFIDLFAGPGRARVATTGELIDGSPLIALKQAIRFTKVILCEANDENVSALRKRVAPYRSAKIVPGDSNSTIGDIVKEIPPAGLNVALIDPFNLGSLVFDTIGQLASFQRMDLIVFFPVNEIRRWLDDKPETYGPYLDRALGTTRWRSVISSGRGDAVLRLINVFREELTKRFSYGEKKTYTTPIRNQNTVLYHLVFASKHTKADEIWTGVTKRTPQGQKKLF